MTTQTTLTLDPAVRAYAIEWLDDCFNDGLDADHRHDFNDMADYQIFVGINRHWDGGWHEFLAIALEDIGTPWAI